MAIRSGQGTPLYPRVRASYKLRFSLGSSKAYFPFRASRATISACIDLYHLARIRVTQNEADRTPTKLQPTEIAAESR